MSRMGFSRQINGNHRNDLGHHAAGGEVPPRQCAGKARCRDPAAGRGNCSSERDDHLTLKIRVRFVSQFSKLDALLVLQRAGRTCDRWTSHDPTPFSAEACRIAFCREPRPASSAYGCLGSVAVRCSSDPWRHSRCRTAGIQAEPSRDNALCRP